jgi:EAL and modified HD-GYP domain-containing signal transduction protein
MALVRARFCELGAEKAGHDPTEQYLLGLFSLLPAMMQISMERAMAKICLREGIRDALLGTCNEESWLLRWMERHERGDWQQCDRIAELRGLDAGELNRHVMAASEWADGMLHPIG